MTEFYDDYIDSYSARTTVPPPLPLPPVAVATKASDRNVANWARTNANPSTTNPNNYPPSNYPLSRAPSRSSPSTNFPSTGSLRRKNTRNQTAPTRSRRTSVYEEEEGYASGDYEEIPVILAKIRIKVSFEIQFHMRAKCIDRNLQVHYQEDVRGMTITPDVTFNEFLDKLCLKFEVTNLDVKFRDEDGGKVSLKDESDYEMAIETAKETAKGRPDGRSDGRLEIWCVDARN